MDNFMDDRVRICTLVTWSAWLAGSVLVIIDTLELADVAAAGLLIALFGTVAWVRDRFLILNRRELVAFDHGRQLERALNQEVVRFPVPR